MLARLNSRNQIRLPKAVTDALGPVAYFAVEVANGRVILTPVPSQRADAVRAKLAELGLNDQDVNDAVTWGRRAKP
jgi:hypothetical protein